ncbi:MAG: tryptophan--tRNA ligase [Myxococcaceae bacterium]
MRILSGVQSSGDLHLGNYYGAIKQFVDLQAEPGAETLYFIANLHALTSLPDGEKIRHYTYQTAAAYLAFGVDPKRSILYRQSDIPEVPEVFWVFNNLLTVPWLERGVAYREKVENRKQDGSLGLLAYPVLQAVDILLYGTDLVPVGKDQQQNVEWAQDIAQKFNSQYVPGYEPTLPNGDATHPAGVFKRPEFRIQAATGIIKGTDGKKMSKSYDNTIPLFADDKTIENTIKKKMQMDSTPLEAPKPLDGPPSTLYELLRLMAPADRWPAIDKSWREGGRGYGHFKGDLLEIFHANFDGARKKYNELIADKGELDRILRDGAERARALAAPYYAKVRQLTGM